jgi:hypothetical protein
MSLEMAHKVILPPKKNYIPQFLKQRDINSYYTWVTVIIFRLAGHHYALASLPRKQYSAPPDTCYGCSVLYVKSITLLKVSSTAQ